MTAPTTDSKMYQTMQGQPAELRRLLAEGWEPATRAAALLNDAERVTLTGIGTSYHAALVGSWLLRAAGVDARAVLSFDLARYPVSYPLGATDAVIVMAHTGVKSFSGAAMARAAAAGATVLSVGSRTAEHPGSNLVLRTTDRETSAAYTASHLLAMTALAQVAVALGEHRGAPAITGFRDALDRLPGQVEGVLAREAEIEPVARAAVERRGYVAATGPNEATALELVIKAREAAHAHIDALAAEQFLHGPMVAVNAGDQAILINVPGAGTERIGEIAATLAAMGVDLWLVGQGAKTVPDATVFALPELPETLSPLLTVIPMQLCAYGMAVARRLNPDTFRRDDPRYAAAFGLLKL